MTRDVYLRLRQLQIHREMERDAEIIDGGIKAEMGNHTIDLSSNRKDIAYKAYHYGYIDAARKAYAFIKTEEFREAFRKCYEDGKWIPLYLEELFKEHME